MSRFAGPNGGGKTSGIDEGLQEDSCWGQMGVLRTHKANLYLARVIHVVFHEGLYRFGRVFRFLLSLNAPRSALV